jgi:hypothetical protein
MSRTGTLALRAERNAHEHPVRNLAVIATTDAGLGEQGS